MRKFGIAEDDAIAIQLALLEGLKAMRKVYDDAPVLSSIEKKMSRYESKRVMEKIAFLNGFTQKYDKKELRELGRLVIE